MESLDELGTYTGPGGSGSTTGSVVNVTVEEGKVGLKVVVEEGMAAGRKKEKKAKSGGFMKKMKKVFGSA